MMPQNLINRIYQRFNIFFFVKTRQNYQAFHPVFTIRPTQTSADYENKIKETSVSDLEYPRSNLPKQQNPSHRKQAQRCFA
jgi:hypothetical protein